ncbi:MAG: oxidoreductase [Candidatus Hydrogenedens sp.]|nr:oxidoreductase [Candidatus Hydrogenedens sp.]
MRRFPIAPGAPEFSAIAYGVWRLADDPEGAAPARVRAKIDACLEAGITTFDHADIYGGYTCEGLFGKALAEAPELRDQMEIVTKCGIKVPNAALPSTRVKHYEATPAWIEYSVDRSLRELQTDRIDLLLIHRPDWLTSAEETAEGLVRVMDSGKVLSVGVSNYSTHQYALLTEFLGAPPATNQVEISLLHMDALFDGTLDQCQTFGVHPMAWSPLAGGRLFGETEAAVRTRAALESVAAEYSATPEQIALAWVAALPSQPQLVIGTNRLERIQSAAASHDILLERQHWFELWAAAQGRSIP